LVAGKALDLSHCLQIARLQLEGFWILRERTVVREQLVDTLVEALVEFVHLDPW